MPPIKARSCWACRTTLSILQRFSRDYPRMKILLQSSFTRPPREQFGRGEIDLMLTTEVAREPGGEALSEVPLVWIGAPGGRAWKARPIPLACERVCIFRQGVQAALDRAGSPWEMAVVSQNTRSVEATVSADPAVHTVLAGSEPRHVERINHGGALPELSRMKIGPYSSQTGEPPQPALAEMLRQAFAGHGARRAQPLATAAA